MSVVVRRKRRLTHEIQNGYPGFAYHQTTTTDLTQDVNRFVVVGNKQSGYRVDHYESNFAAIPPINRRNHARNSFIVCAGLLFVIAVTIGILL